MTVDHSTDRTVDTDAPGTAPVPWQGLNHLALITDDMDTTVRFWHGVLGMPLVATLSTPTFRHYFFATGPAASVAFFEYRDEPYARIDRAAGVFDSRSGQFDHVAVDLPDEAAVLALRDRIRACGSEATDVVDHGLMCSIYFTDPNGIACEASYWKDDPTGDVVAPGRYFADSDPVPAAVEIRSGGLRGGLPRTRLVDTSESFDAPGPVPPQGLEP